MPPGGASAATAGGPVSLTAQLGGGARLGQPAAIDIALKIDLERIPFAVTQLKLYTPKGLEITSSGLGIDTCEPPEPVFTDVLVHGRVLAECPKNAVLARGTVTAAILLSAERTIPANGVVTLFAGAPRENRPGLLAYVLPRHPIRAQLAYGGFLFEAPKPFGLGMQIDVPPVPRNPFNAPVALAGMKLGIGAPAIVYRRRAHGKLVKYRPGGVPLPTRCPPSGSFRFRARLTFSDGERFTADARAACPGNRSR